MQDILERKTRLELATPAWEADALPTELPSLEHKRVRASHYDHLN